jgi:hydroxyacyl-ACP dehydratase HTD2-like protein with hotdog domain
VFRPALPYPPVIKKTGSSSPSIHQQQPQASLQTTSDSFSNDTHKRQFRRSSVTLFRFSALTFNPHKIHYDLPWARDVEGHRNIVVHGPLNLISILDFWRDIQHKSGKFSDSALVVPRSISYRATSPLYADEEYEIVLEATAEGNKVNIYNHSGIVSMKADIKE